MFSKILIANRGEIACRVIRTAKALNIKTVAVYSEADANAPHVRLADEAILIGGPASSDSYLRIDKLIDVALDTGAEAIHPGYGFLSENAEFSRAVTNAGMIFVGPPADVIERMGDKITARNFAAQHGVPVTPSAEEESDPTTFAERAVSIGFPLLIKGTAGGGGKGMHIVREASNLAQAIASSRAESQRYFGDGRLSIGCNCV